MTANISARTDFPGDRFSEWRTNFLLSHPSLGIRDVKEIGWGGVGVIAVY